MPILWLKMGSMMERAVNMSTSDSSIFSNIASIVECNIVKSRCLCGRRPHILKSRSKAVMYRWICLNFDSSLMYLLVRSFICAISFCNRKVSLLI